MDSLDELLKKIREKKRKEEQMTIEESMKAYREEYIEKPRRERQKYLRESEKKYSININRDD